MNAQTRKLFYGISSVITGVLAILVATNVVDHSMEVTASTWITGLIGIFGTGATATAAYHTSKQIKAGELDPAAKDSPPPAPYNPADAVVGGLQDLNTMHAHVQEGFGRIQEAAATVGIPLPVTPQASQYPEQAVVPPTPTDLVQQAIDASRRSQ